MIIVSQDKTMIFNYENIEAIGIKELDDNGNYAILVETVSDNQYPIAEYKTEERAKEVLQDIIKLYAKQVNTTHYTNINNIYEMPKE